jgi:hypothetical protein
MGVFNRLKKAPYNPDAPVNVPGDPDVPGSSATPETTKTQSIFGPETPERHEQIGEEPARAVPAATPAHRYVSVPDARFNLEDTNRLAQGMQIPREQRDNPWLTEFQDAAWNASIVLPAEPVFLGPDGMP